MLGCSINDNFVQRSNSTEYSWMLLWGESENLGVFSENFPEYRYEH